MPYKVCILTSERNGRYYIGFTQDVETRLALHNSGKVKSTKYLRPLRLVYTEDYETAAEARERERRLKASKSKLVIQRLLRQVGR